MGGRYTGFDTAAKTNIYTRALMFGTNAHLDKLHTPIKEEVDIALHALDPVPNRKFEQLFVPKRASIAD